MASERVIVALDVDRAERAQELVDALGRDATHFKIGLQLLTSAGPALVRELVADGRKVFLDLKLFEIPNSAAGTVMAAGELGVSMLTVHASAGSKVLRAAVEAARGYPDLRIVALTVITSMRDADLGEVGIEDGVDAHVVRLARLALGAGCDGVVASPHEVALLRRVLPAGALIVTPGTQLAGETPTDQARVATPTEAIRAGASHLVVGRSITQASRPHDVFVGIRDQVARAASP